MHTSLKVLKADGSIEAFDPDKLERSLINSKASPADISKIIDHVRNEVGNGITTGQIYKHAFFLLHKLKSPAAYRYSMRQAVSNLGPSGFPFEKYIAEIYKSQGLTAEINQQVKGGCTTHEVDVVAWNDARLLMTEAKFHNQRGMKCDLKVVLYVKARFDDLLEATHFYGGKRRKITENVLITNTTFTTTAIEYGMCKGMHMIGWNFPGRGSLQQMIEDGDLMPVTCLSTLHAGDLRLLLDAGLVLCKQIRDNLTILIDAGLPRNKAQAIVDEVKSIYA